MSITKLNRRYDTALAIIKHAIKENVSLHEACRHYNVGVTYVRDYITRGDADANLKRNIITQNEYENIINYHNIYQTKKTLKNEPEKNKLNDNRRYDKALSIIKYAIKRNISLHDSCSHHSVNCSYISDYMIRGDVEANLKANKITQDEYDNITTAYEIYKSKKSLKNNTNTTSDQTLDEKYDKRSSYDVIRDEDTNKIVKYSFRILVRDEDDYVGELTREQMETIYANYPYVTQKSVSDFFPYLTFVQFKKIIRCFNITKDRLFPQHILEEKNEQEIALLALKNKEKASYKKFIELKPVEVEKQLRDTQLELHKLKTERDFIGDLIKDYLTNYNTKTNISDLKQLRKENNSFSNEKALIVYLSDLHIGAMNKDTQYSTEYNSDVYYERLGKLLDEVITEIEETNPEKIIVIGLGDMLDGYNQQTTRGGHPLPQNMSNKEQFTTYMDSMIYFFDVLVDNFKNDIEFIHVGQSNHGGDFEYGANKALEYILKLKSNGQVNVRIFEKNIEHFTYGEHTIILTHGKDTATMSRNMPMHVNPNAEKLINDYIYFNKIKSDSILFIKGDLHNHNSETLKNFKYINIPSIYGGSGYTDANFGYTKPATIIHILNKNKTRLNEIYVELG